MEVLPFTADHEQDWDAFIRGSRNGTFFHTRAFLAYHAEGKFTDASLAFKDGPKIVALLPAADVDDAGVRTLVSHPGASYGGLALSNAEGMETTGGVIDALITHARENGFKRIRFLRLTPPSVRKASSDDQEYWLFQKGFRPFRIELATSLFLDGMEPNDVLQHFDGKCRNMVRQAERAGIRVEETDDWVAFWKILEGMLAAKHQSKPTHSIDEIIRLVKLTGDSVRLFGAYLGDELVGGTVAISLHDKAVYTLYMAQDYAHQKHHPLHAILAELARVCIDEGRSVLHFGISTEDGGTKVNQGLFFFKESFGGRSVRRESWQLDL